MGKAGLKMASVEKQVQEVTKGIEFDKTKYQVLLETNYGNILLDLYPDVAPNHCKNIIGLSKTGFYDGLSFHRIIKGFVIQGGCPSGDGTGGPGYNVNAEFNSRPHEKGVLSMARAQNPNSAGSQFFICLGKQAFLDNQYTVFGKTADEASLAVVAKIGEVTTAANDRPVEGVVIKKASVKEMPL